MFENLQELTGQESGIVIYTNEGIICNWSNICGLPRLFGEGIVGLGEQIPEAEGKHMDLAEILNGVNITICGSYNDEELPQSGTVYQLPDNVVVIAPDDWC